MRGDVLARVSGFRALVLFMGVVGLASLISLVLIYLDTERFMYRHLDDWLRREDAAMLASAPGDLAGAVSEHMRFDPADSWPISLFDGTGAQLAGPVAALPRPLPADNQPFDFSATVAGQTHRYRGIVERLADGRMLLISERRWWASPLDRSLLERAVWGLGLAAAVGLGAAAVVGAQMRRRVAMFTEVTGRIVTGDLSGRLPTGRSAGDLDRLAGLVNGMLDQIERLITQVGSFRDAVAHDLSTPLARLQVTLEGARARAGDVAAYEAAIDAGLAEARRLGGMLAAVRRLSEVQDRARRAGFCPVDLGPLVAEVFDFYQPVADEHGVTLALEPAGGDATLSGDRDLLFEAIGNLLDNAIKFTPSGGRVLVRVHDGARPGLTIIDTGPGIAAGEEALIKRRYYRSESSRSVEGTGLGLALVAAIAELHRLDLDISSAEPGCRVSLRQPGAAAAATAPARPATYLTQARIDAIPPRHSPA